MTEKARIAAIRARRLPGFEYDNYGQGENVTRERAVARLASYRKMKARGSQKYLTPSCKDSARKNILLALQRLTLDKPGNLFLEYPTVTSQDKFWGLKKLPVDGYKIRINR